jgi:hypothetical protein
MAPQPQGVCVDQSLRGRHQHCKKKVETFVLLSQGVASNLIIRKQQQPTYIRDVKTKGL